MRGPEPNGIAARFAAADSGAGASAQPALRREGLRVGKVALADAVVAQHAPDLRARRHRDVADDGVAQRLQRDERRHRFQAHRLAGARVEEIERVDLLERDRGQVRHRLAHLALRARQRVRVAVQQVDHPGERVGGGVLAGEQHGQHVADHLRVTEAAVGLVGGDDHRFEQVARLLAQRRLVAQTLARLGDEVGDGRR